MSIVRRGDASVILLVVGALVLCILALSLFITYTSPRDKGLEEAQVLFKSVEAVEQYVQASAVLILKEAVICKECSAQTLQGKVQEIAGTHYSSIENTNFFGRIRNGDFNVHEEGNSYYLTVPGVLFQVRTGANSMQRTQTISVSFVLE